VKTTKLIAEALGKESSSGSVKSCCKKNQASAMSNAAVKRTVLGSFLNDSVFC